MQVSNGKAAKNVNLSNNLVRRLSNTNFLNRDVAEKVVVIAQFIDIDINSKVYKLKEFVCGPKLKPDELACINDPITEELINNFNEIKRVSLEHCSNILLKNKIREAEKYLRL